MSEAYTEITEKSIKRSIMALVSFISESTSKDIDLERIMRVALLLVKSGAFQFNPILSQVEKVSINCQKNDGGWIGVEDSLWSVAFLKESKENPQQFKFGLQWLKKQQLASGGWGKSYRDIGRVPITGLLLYLLPELSNRKSLGWLENQWKRDIVRNPKLTYKRAFCLMAVRKSNIEFNDNNLLENTLKWLASQQNEDCGWGPWREHPVGSSPFCTGVALTGVLQYPEKIDRTVIVDGLKWIEKNQLDSGLWPDHYIEEGSAWCFYALTEGYRFLKSHP